MSELSPSAISHCSRSRVASLAPETLALIFTLGASSCTGHPEALYDTTSFPVLVSHVSRRWRAVALSTPCLWSTIVVCKPFAPQVPAGYSSGSLQSFCLAETTCLLRLQTFLERSKSSPLTLYVDIRSPSWFFHPNECDHPFTPEHMSALLDHLLPHLDRWEDVEILSDTWAPLDVFLERCSRPEPRDIERRAKTLRRLALSRCNAYFVLEGTQFAPAALKSYFAPFKGSPLLRDVTLSGVHVNWGHHILHNLTSLSLKYHAQEVLPSASELVNMVNSSPNLESLSILGWGARSFDDDLSRLEGSIFLNSIVRITLGWVSAHYALCLLSLFAWRMPKLSSITLEDIANSLDPLSAQDSSCIVDFISTRLSGNGNTSKSLCTPFELTLNSVRASFNSLCRLMEGLPSLQSLVLHDVDDALLKILRPLRGEAEDESILCPELTHVVVRTAGCVPRVELERMVRAREIACDLTLSSTRHINLEIVDLLISDAETEFFANGILDEDNDVTFYENYSRSDLLTDEYDASGSEDEFGSEESSFSTPPPYAISADGHEHDFKPTKNEDSYWPIVADGTTHESLVGRPCD